MKRLSVIVIILIFQIVNLKTVSALSVTSSLSSLDCSLSSVTFTFDCSFNGAVLVPSTPPPGVVFSNTPGNNPLVWNIANGEATINIDITNFGSAGNFSIDFQVLSSDQACAVSGDMASVAFSYDCTIPANDECIDAIPLAVGFNSCAYVNYPTANTSGSTPISTCGPSTFVDLWYSFYANSTTVTLEYNQNPGTIGFYVIHDGCPLSGGSEVACDFAFNSNNMPGTLDFVVPNINTQYFLQIRFNSFDNGTDQSFCLQTATPPSPCPYYLAVSDAGPNLPNSSYQASDIIETIGSTIVSSSNVLYQAGQSVLLNGGFEAISTFEIEMTGCIP